MAPEHGFNFTQRDAVAAELHLIVEAAEEFNLAVRAPASPVAGPVKQRGPPGPRFPVLLEIHAFLASGRFARTWLSALRFAAERIADEFLRREFRTIQVAARDAFAADENFSGHAGGHGLEIFIENVNLCVCHGP